MPPVGRIIAGIALMATAAIFPGMWVMAFGVMLHAGAIAAIGGSLLLGGVGSIIQQKKLRSLSLGSQAAQVSVRQAAAPRVVAIGRSRLGAIYALLHPAGTNNVLIYFAHLFVGHEIEEFTKIYFDAVEVTLDGSGNGTGGWAGLVKIEKHLGARDQTASTLLTTDIPTKWTSAHRLRGIAYLCGWIKFDATKFPNGFPNITADIKGRKVWDPRSGTIAYSENAALCLADYMAMMPGTTQRELGAVKKYPLTAGLLSHSGMTVFSAAELVNGTVGGNGLGTDSASSGAYVKIDLGAGVTKEFRLFRLWANAAGSTAQFKVRHSDDDAGYTDAATACLADLAGWNKFEVAPNGAHRYWRIELANTPGAGPEFDEIELYESRVNRAQLVAAANICDEDVTLKAGGTEDRYTCNGNFLMDAQPGNIIQNMSEAMAAPAPVYVGGEWHIYPGAYITPTVTLDENDFTGELAITTRQSRRDIFNAVRILFVDPAQNWKPTNAPPMIGASYVAEDGGEVIWDDLELAFTISASRAQRIAKIFLEKARRQIAVEVNAKLSGYQVAPPQTLFVNNMRLGWSAKVFRVESLQLTFEQQSGEGEEEIQVIVSGTHLALREEDSSIYSWTAATDETTPSTGGTVTAPALLSNPVGYATYRPTTNPLTATDAGATATVSVAAFTNRIQGVGDRAINSGSVTALSFATLYYIYYDDASLAGGAVTFAATTTKETAINGIGRFFVGSILTPADGAADTAGNNDGGTGAQFGTHIARKSTTETTLGTVTGSGNGKDGNWATKITASVTGQITNAPASVILSGFGQPEDFGRFYKNLKIIVKAAASVTNESDATGTSTLAVRTSVNGGSSWTDFRTASAVGAGDSASLALQIDSIALADGSDPNQVQVEVRDQGHTGGGANDGSLVADMYEAVLIGDF